VAEQERKDRIMVITSSDDERDVLVESTLGPQGYDVQSASDGGTGLSMALENRPDVIILDLHLDGLKGQDVMAALNAQAVDVPIIAIANRGEERALLDSFRLGAKDYVMRPLREAEIIQTVERALKEVRLQREREQLISEVRESAHASERHLRELKMLMGIGRSVTAATQPKEVFDRVMRAAIQLTGAETTGLFLVKPETGELIVEAGQNMSRNLIENLNHPIVDDLASLVMNSQEAYMGSGEGLQKFRPAQQGAASVIYAPMVYQDKPVGVLWVSNARLGFDAYLRDIMSSLADYAAIAVNNVRLYEAISARADEAALSPHEMETVQVSHHDVEQEGAASSQVLNVVKEIRRPLTDLLGNMNLFRTGEMGEIAAGQQAAVDVMHRQLDSLVRRIDQLVPPDSDAL
jgi:DNA-binding response OmpR family regulator